MHHSTAERCRHLGRGQTLTHAPNPDFSLVGLLHAGDRFDERRFAGPVLTDETEHFARTEIDIDAVERDNAGEALDDASKFDDGVHFTTLNLRING
jgi:hypothetical protein